MCWASKLQRNTFEAFKSHLVIGNFKKEMLLADCKGRVLPLEIIYVCIHRLFLECSKLLRILCHCVCSLNAHEQLWGILPHLLPTLVGPGNKLYSICHKPSSQRIFFISNVIYIQLYKSRKIMCFNTLLSIYTPFRFPPGSKPLLRKFFCSYSQADASG